MIKPSFDRKPKWEAVVSAPAWGETYRLRVPGGWIYMMLYYNTAVFVPAKDEKSRERGRNDG